MFNYDYLEGQSLENLNELGLEGWEVIDLTKVDTPAGFNVFLKRGKYGYELIQVDTENNNNVFLIDKSFSYGESIMVIFLFMFLVGSVAKLLYGFIWKND